MRVFLHEDVRTKLIGYCDYLLLAVKRTDVYFAHSRNVWLVSFVACLFYGIVREHSCCAFLRIVLPEPLRPLKHMQPPPCSTNLPASLPSRASGLLTHSPSRPRVSCWCKRLSGQPPPSLRGRRRFGADPVHSSMASSNCAIPSSSQEFPSTPKKLQIKSSRGYML